MENKNRQLNEEILGNNKRILETDEEKAKLQEVINDLKSSKGLLNQEKDLMLGKERDLSSKLKEKTD